MLISFFDTLRRAGIPVSIGELLDLLAALDADMAFADMDDFYYLSRACMVKDEKHYDRFDRAFAAYYKDLQTVDDLIELLIPDDWLRDAFNRQLTEEEKAKLTSLGSLEQLIEAFKQRLAEQESRHQGGNKWIGTGGTSPFGHGGYHPQGIRIGGPWRQGRAAKVWERRDFKPLDDTAELGTRTMKLALRRLRQFARTGARDQLDLDRTIRATANNAGLLDIQWVPERHNAVKVLLFFDVGGSMDPYVDQCQQLFSAARSEFKQLDYYYFHNFVYEAVWKNPLRRHTEKKPLQEILHTYSRDYKIIFVGDATMSPYEILYPGGSVDHWNEQAGEVWMRQLLAAFDKVVWINPELPQRWQFTESILLIRQLLDGHMYPLTLQGLDEAMRYLTR